jgi:hypothetical protein
MISNTNARSAIERRSTRSFWKPRMRRPSTDRCLVKVNDQGGVDVQVHVNVNVI